MSQHRIKDYRFATRGMGSEPIPGTVEIEIDWDKLARVMGRKAADNLSRKSKLGCGITVKWKPAT